MPAAKPRRLVYTPLDELIPADRNARLHDLAGLAAKMERFGYLDPVVVDERTGKIVGGHGRLEALQQGKAAGLPAPEGIEVAKGVWKVPVVRGWSSSDDLEADAANLALNPSPNDPGFDSTILAEILGDLQEASALDGSGFDESALSALLASLEPPEAQPEPDATEAPEEPIPADPVTKRGDVWIIGEHRLMCGDCRKPADVARALDGRRIHVAFTSPPYAAQRSYDKSSGFKPIKPAEYAAWFALVAANVEQHLAEDGSWFVNIRAHAEDGQRDLYVFDLVIAHVREWGWKFVDDLCWVRGGMPGFFPNRFRNEWEPVFHFSRSAVIKHRPENVRSASDVVPVRNPDTWMGVTVDGGYETGANGEPERVQGLANPGNVITISGGADKGDGGIHPAAFPSRLPGWFIRAYSDAGDVIYDPFMGSGSTLIAAHRHQRPAVGLELSPGYVDAALARIERHTGIVPVLEATGQPHSFLEGAS